MRRSREEEQRGGEEVQPTRQPLGLLAGAALQQPAVELPRCCTTGAAGAARAEPADVRVEPAVVRVEPAVVMVEPPVVRVIRQS